MNDFAKTLIIALVVSAVSVVAFFCIVYYLALNWSMLVRRAMPNRWAEPPSEKSAWPQPRRSSEIDFFSSPVSSPRSSRMSTDLLVKGPKTYSDKSYSDKSNPEEPITPPRNVKL